MKKAMSIFAVMMLASTAYAEGEAVTEQAPAAAATDVSKNAPAVKPASTSEVKTTEAAPKADIRKPTKDVEKFWSELSWEELTPDERSLWTVLGWSEKNWSSDDPNDPASNSKDWKNLSKEEQAAASALGYNEQEWDVE